MATKSQKVIFASRILERFSYVNWSDSVVKARMNLELKHLAERSGTKQQRKQTITRLSLMMSMNSDINNQGSAGGLVPTDS